MASFQPKPFGKYFLVERLAIGGMAEIYKAKTFGVDGFEKLIAIKKILPHFSADKEFIAMLTDEAKLVVRLSHTNIVQIYDLGKVGDDYYISMEFIDGVNLREVINRGKELKEKIPLPLSLYIASEICKGLDYAHSKRDHRGQPLGIVHRDVSPQNILISFEGETKIVDFGIAKAAMNVSQTTAGTLKGKITYMSPEQALGKPIDARTDLFSVGILLFEMASGERLYTGDTQFEVLKKIRTTQIDKNFLAGRVPPELEPVLLKALAYQPKDRFETAGDFQIALTKMLYSQHSEFSPKQLAQLIQNWFSSELKVRNSKAEEDESVSVHTRELLQEANKQKSIVNRVDETGTAKLSNQTTEADDFLPHHFVDTVKPEEKITPDQFVDHGKKEEAPEEKSAKKEVSQVIQPIQRKTLWYALAVFLVLLVFSYLIVSTDSDKAEAPDEEPAAEEQAEAPVQPQPKPDAPAFAQFGSVAVESDPADASIFLDQADLQKKTPANLNDLKIGREYRLKVVKEGFLPFEKPFTLTDSNLLSLKAKLEKIPVGSVSLDSNPSGARIFLNGTDTGKKTPASLTELALPQTYEITFKKEKYADLAIQVEVAQPEPIEKKVELELDAAYKPATLQVTANVSGASVTVNGEKKGSAPATVSLGAGDAKVRVAKSGYTPQEKTISLEGGKTSELKFELEAIAPKEPPAPKPEKKAATPPPPAEQSERPAKKPTTPAVAGTGSVRLDSSPRGASVTVNGEKAGITPVVVPNLSSSKSHTVTISLPGYKAWSKTFTFGQNHVEFMAKLQKE